MKVETRCVDNHIADAVLSVLRYYSLFSYPLKAGEVYGSLPVACTLSALLVTLEDMEEGESIHRYDGYYSLDPDVRGQMVKRKEANKLAGSQKPLAMRIGRFIYKFPFVRFVGISGSLSKGAADKNSDFDYFIVTEENRLWICRTLLHLFKKLTFIAGQQHKFCMNYFIDMHNLQLEEQNRFTAIELSSLIPTAGFDIYNELMTNNAWVNNFLPNGYTGFDDGEYETGDRHSSFKAMWEFIGNHIFPMQLNTFLMRLTNMKWKKKWARKNYPMEDYDIAFKTTLHVSKNHAANHQKRVLKALSKFENKKTVQ